MLATMSLISLRVELRALRLAINELRDGIAKRRDTVSTAEKEWRDKPSPIQSVKAVISFDEDTKRDTKAENKCQYSAQNGIRKATWCAFGAAVIYAGLAAWQACTFSRQLRTQEEQLATQRTEFTAENRPWIGLEQTPGSHNVKDFGPDGDKAKVTMIYQLSDEGRWPAAVYVAARIEDIGHVDPTPTQLEQECAKARQGLVGSPLTILPNLTSPYALAYDGKKSNFGSEHTAEFEVPHGVKGRIFTNYGCVAYRSTADSSVGYTPFKAFLDFGKPEPEITNGPFVTGGAE